MRLQRERFKKAHIACTSIHTFILHFLIFNTILIRVFDIQSNVSSIRDPKDYAFLDMKLNRDVRAIRRSYVLIE